MIGPSPDFAERYASALGGFVALPDEAGLERAYALGREALSAGCGVIDLTAIHARALRGVSPVAGQAEEDRARRAWHFLAETLAPFEMALRGFREANGRLKEAAATLERRVLERTSELSAAERGFREQTRILHCVVESMSDGLAVADGAGKLLLVNSAWSRVLGVEPIDHRLFQPDGSTPFPAAELPLLRATRGEQTPAVSILVQGEALGDGVHLSVLGSPLRDEAGKVEGGVAVFRDITETRRATEALRKTEEQLRQSQKMEAIGRLAGGIAHDFNNLLSVILSFSAMALEDLSAGDPLAVSLDEIQKAGNRAAGLTRQLLMFSRQQVLAPAILDLNEVLAGMDKMLQRLVGADVALALVPGVPLGRIRADRGSLEQVVMNLVVNARDAMPTGGQLTIESANAVLDEAFAAQHLGVPAGPYVMLVVTDTGLGMDRATQARIFEPFFTTKEQGKGTGLGLSTVFGIVKQSGGSIWVYSEPGKGTTFKIYLPLAEGEVEAPEAIRPAESAAGSETILLVDDDDQVRAVARNILERKGYQVLAVRNAGEALLSSEAHAGEIHLLLADVVMPQLSGPELARRLALTRPGMRVLCMSGYTDDTIVRHGVLEARIAYLQKPLVPEALAKKVRAVLDAPGPG